MVYFIKAFYLTKGRGTGVLAIKTAMKMETTLETYDQRIYFLMFFIIQMYTIKFATRCYCFNQSEILRYRKELSSIQGFGNQWMYSKCICC